jgi:nucleotide-binding universal stress UspA family protein
VASPFPAGRRIVTIHTPELGTATEVAPVLVAGGNMPRTIVVRQATDLASREGASLHFVAAYPDPQVLREKIIGGSTAQPVDLRGVAIGVLKRAEHGVPKGLELETHAREGDPAEVIIQVANEQQADLIIVGNSGLTGIKRFLLGSVSSKVSHHAPCSVMIVRRA